MKFRKLILLCLVFVPVTFGVVWGILKKQATPEPVGTAYYVDTVWPELQNGVGFGQVSGLDVDRDGNVWVLHRADRIWQGETLALDFIADAVILVLDGDTGEVLDQWGRNTFVMPHSLTLDAVGNVWITDVGLHQVLKFDTAGNLQATFGEQGVAGEDAAHFNMPTDVAFAPDGSFYVSDGYGNNRIMHFSADGELLHQWGSAGSAPGQFNLPHSVALDAGGRAYVADRGNSRLQIFTATGEWLATWDRDTLGRPWAVQIGADGFVYVVDGGDQQDFWPDRARILKLDTEGNILAAFGSHGNGEGQFIWPHTIAISDDGLIYVGDVRRVMGVQRFSMEPPVDNDYSP